MKAAPLRAWRGEWVGQGAPVGLSALAGNWTVKRRLVSAWLRDRKQFSAGRRLDQQMPAGPCRVSRKLRQLIGENR